MLSADDPVDWSPQRITVAGTSGTGKTTLARRIGAALDLPVTEIDSLYHGPNWTERPTFVDDATAVVESDAWVIEWQYSRMRPLIADRADTLVWLDLPVRTTMSRVIRRTVSRRRHRTELWNGNLEEALWKILIDHDHIIRWAWRTRHKMRHLVPVVARAHPDLHVVRLCSQDEVDRWVAGLTRMS